MFHFRFYELYELLFGMGVNPLGLGNAKDANELAKIIDEDDKKKIKTISDAIRFCMKELNSLNTKLKGNPKINKNFNEINVSIFKGGGIEISLSDNKYLNISYRIHDIDVNGTTLNETILKKKLLYNNFDDIIKTGFIDLVVGALYYDIKKLNHPPTISISTTFSHGHNNYSFMEFMNLQYGHKIYEKVDFEKRARAYGITQEQINFAIGEGWTIYKEFYETISELEKNLESAFVFENEGGGLRRSRPKGDTSSTWISKGTRVIQGKERTIYTKNNGKNLYIKQKENGKMVYKKI